MSDRLRSWLVIGGLCSGVIVVAVVVAWVVVPRPAVPREIAAARHTVAFDLYYPTTLPQDFRYEKQSLKSSAELVIYKLDYGQGKRLFVSIQPKPKDVVFNDFYNRIMTNKVDALSTQGKAVVGNVNGQTVGSLVTDKVWILMNAPSAVSAQQITQLVGNLAPVR